MGAISLYQERFIKNILQTNNMSELIIITIVFFVPFFTLVDLYSSRSVYGKFISEKRLDNFFESHWDDVVSHGTSKNLFYTSFRGTFVAKALGLFSNWYISEHGQIPRWSKWSKKLSDEFERQGNSLL